MSRIAAVRAECAARATCLRSSFIAPDSSRCSATWPGRAPRGTAAAVVFWLARLAAAALVAFCGALAICALSLRLQWHLEQLTDGHVLAYPLVLLFLIFWPLLEFVCCVASKRAAAPRPWPQQSQDWPDRSCSRSPVEPIQRRLPL